jgi:hypothetical protein
MTGDAKRQAAVLHWNDAGPPAVTGIAEREKVSSRSQKGSGRRDREQHLRVLADKLLFKVEKSGAGFTLSRSIDVSRPVRREGLSLDQAEELLETWKLRGLQGG